MKQRENSLGEITREVVKLEINFALEKKSVYYKIYTPGCRPISRWSSSASRSCRTSTSMGQRDPKTEIFLHNMSLLIIENELQGDQLSMAVFFG